jgi:hypothetical protein
VWRSPKPPEGLGEPGVQLWTSIAGEFVLNAGEVEILSEDAATAARESFPSPEVGATMPKLGFGVPSLFSPVDIDERCTRG